MTNFGMRIKKDADYLCLHLFYFDTSCLLDLLENDFN